MGAMAIFMTSLWPLWHTVRAMFGLSMLFYGQEFATLAFHVVVFRLCGWKKVWVEPYFSFCRVTVPQQTFRLLIMTV